MGGLLLGWRIIAGLKPGVGVDDRQVLALLAAGPLPAAQLARALGLSGQAVAARMAGLQAAGVALQHDGSHWQLLQPPDLHDVRRIDQALLAPVRASLAGLEVLWQVDSTNSELLRRPVPVEGFRCCWPSSRLPGAAGAGAAGFRRWRGISICRWPVVSNRELLR